jgi:choline trimethylamine-lyase
MSRTERVTGLREMMLRIPEVCVERAYYMTESYTQTESFPNVLRRAKALANVLEKMPVRIEAGELIVGWPTGKVRGGTLIVELNSEWILRELDTVQDRKWEKYQPLTREEKDRITNYIMPYWKGKTLYEKWDAAIPEKARALENIIQSSGGYVRSGHHAAHVAANYQSILNSGLNQLMRGIEGRMASVDLHIPGELEKHHFYEAALITQRAVIRHAERYAELAESLADAETNEKRRHELKMIVEACRWVPANKPRTFYEAIQAIWMVYIALMIEGWGAGMSLGRPDQYLLPFYLHDIDTGIITREEAHELLCLLLIKLNSAINLEEGFLASCFAGYPVMCGLTIGGVTPDGSDAVNDLSYLFLDAEEDIGLTSEDVVVRINKKNPESFAVRSFEVAKNLKGKLKFVSDETTIQSMLYNGIPIAYARDYISTGCHNPTVPFCSHDIGGIVFNYAMMMELALNDGKLRSNGMQVGPQTGDPRTFKSFEEVVEAFHRQYEAMLQVSFLYRYQDMLLLATDTPCPLLSSFLDSCLEKGVDIYNVGTYPYATHTTGLGGVADVGDSLAAIKKVVFDDRKITMETLIKALDNNFEGFEEVRHLLQKAPKFGNDDDHVDLILKEVLARSCDYSRQFKTYKDRKCTTSSLTMTANIPFGAGMGATPDGRKAGEPLAEGGISPHQGRNISGATATLNSVAKLDQVKLTNGSILNMRISPGTVKDNNALRKFTAMIRTFFENGGNLVQFNFTDNKILRDAQKHPENYKDLLVRVATYSAYFIEISPELQDNIIERIELE